MTRLRFAITIFTGLVSLFPGQSTAQNFKAIAHLRGHAGEVRCLAFSPDGKKLVVGSGDFGKGKGQIKVWDVDNQTELDSFFGHSNAVSCIAFSPDGKMIATGSVAEFLRPAELTIWPFDRAMIPLATEAFAVWDAKFVPDGKRLYSAHHQGWIKIWDVGMEKEEAKIEDYESPIVSIAISSNGQRLASAAKDGKIKLWDCNTRKEIRSIKPFSHATKIAYSPDDKSLVVAGGDYERESFKWVKTSIVVWNIESGETTSLGNNIMPTTGLIFSRDGDRLICTMEAVGVKENPPRPQLEVWDLPAKKALKTLPLPSAIKAIAISPDGSIIAGGFATGTVELWHSSNLLSEMN